ncbi:MAG: cytochrome c oxidase accessory protein CcoG [bacterium]
MNILNARQLPEDRLTTTDEKGHRVYIHPADVRGRFRKWRAFIHAGMILFFLILPWIRIGGHQAVLLDIPHRRFALFGLTFWAHDAPILLFVFGAIALTIGFITALWGRIWCGWGCPQTVFVEGVFRRIERWVEGDSVARRSLSRQPWTFEKFWKKVFKWALFAAAGMVITHSFLAYFVGTEDLLKMMRSSPYQNPAPFLFMIAATALVLFDFGWFREQFCTIVCPYGRFQSVLMDDHSLVIAYDAKRGEPRRGKTEEGQKEGDCVNCFRCVDVCPTGIDIRRGVQLECIACTACIDACDEVMERLERPQGLIRYDSLLGLEGEPSRSLSPRTWVYLALIGVMIAGLVFTIYRRQNLDVAFVRAKEAPYQEMKKGDAAEIVNHYKVDLSNQSFEDVQLRFETDPSLVAENFKLITPLVPLPLPAGKSVRADLFVEFPKSALKDGRAKVRVQLVSLSEKTGKETKRTEEIPLVGPFF